jgi:hypothetical protein
VADDADLATMVRQGVAIMVATRDAGLRPEAGRGWGPVLSEDGARLTLCVEVAPDSAMADNLEHGSPVAAFLAQLTSRTSVQVKGRVVDVATPTQERLDAVTEHLDRFIAEMAVVGGREAIARAFVSPDLLSVTIEVAERLDESMGSGGERPS